MHLHPEYEARSRQTIREFGNWIEGQLRLNPAYKSKACIEANLFAMGANDPERAHAAYRTAQALTAQSILAGRPREYTPEWALEVFG